MVIVNSIYYNTCKELVSENFDERMNEYGKDNDTGI